MQSPENPKIQPTVKTTKTTTNSASKRTTHASPVDDDAVRLLSPNFHDLIPLLNPSAPHHPQ